MNIKTRTEKKFTYQNENDTTLTYIVEEDDFHVATHLLLEYQFPDGEINPDLMEYNAAFEEASLKKIAQELLDEIKDYLDNRDTDSFEVQQGVPVVPQYQYYDDFTRTALYAFEEALKKIVNEEGVQKMHKYMITVTETSSVQYVVEAPNEKAAQNLFADWAEWGGDADTSYRLEKGMLGWDYGMPEKVHDDCSPDINYEGLIDATKDSIEYHAKSQMMAFGIPTDNATLVQQVVDAVVCTAKFKETGNWTSDDIIEAIKNVMHKHIDSLGQ